MSLHPQSKLIFLLTRSLGSLIIVVVVQSLSHDGLQHDRLPCPSPSLRACSNLCPLSQWCHPMISSSVVPFSSCPQSFPASGFFPMSQLFASGGQSIGVSPGLISFRMDWLDLFAVQGTLKSLLQHLLGSFLCIFPFGSFILSCFFKAFSFGQDQL